MKFKSFFLSIAIHAAIIFLITHHENITTNKNYKPNYFLSKDTKINIVFSQDKNIVGTKKNAEKPKPKEHKYNKPIGLKQKKIQTKKIMPSIRKNQKNNGASNDFILQKAFLTFAKKLKKHLKDNINTNLSNTKIEFIITKKGSIKDVKVIGYINKDKALDIIKWLRSQIMFKNISIKNDIKIVQPIMSLKS